MWQRVSEPSPRERVCEVYKQPALQACSAVRSIRPVVEPIAELLLLLTRFECALRVRTPSPILEHR